MTSRVEQTNLDDIDSEFDNKENAYQNNVFHTKANFDKGYEELETSEMSMRLKYSITPSSSPMSKSFATVCSETKRYDRFDNTLNSTFVNATNNFTPPSDAVNCPTETKSLIHTNISTAVQHSNENFHLTSAKFNSGMALSDSLMNNNESMTVINRDQSVESPHPSSSSSPLLNIIAPDVSPKEIPKSLDSPIMRGLKSVFNIFRSSQSPVLPSNTDRIPESVKKTQEVNTLSPDSTRTNIKTNTVLASTPICSSKTKDENGPKRSSPYKDSVVFNEDLVNELQWNNETTILFRDEKIPIQKLLLQKVHSSSPESHKHIEKTAQKADILDETIVEDRTNSELTNTSLNEQEPRNNTIMKSNFMLPSYSNKEPSGSVGNQEDDPEFLDCENTFTSNDTYSEAVDPANNCNENSEKKNALTTSVFERVVVPSIVQASVIIEQQGGNEQSGKNKIYGESDVPQNNIFYDIVESLDDLKINSDGLLPNFDINNKQNAISDCEDVSLCGSKIFDTKMTNLNSKVELCCEYISDDNIKSLKQMALAIVHSEHGKTENEQGVLTNDLLKGTDILNRNLVNDSMLKLDDALKEHSIREVKNPVIEESEVKSEKQLPTILMACDKFTLMPQEKFNAKVLAQDTDCFNNDPNTNQKEYLEPQKFEEALLFSEKNNPYVSFNAEQSHNIEDSPNLEYLHNSLATIIDRKNFVIQSCNVKDQSRHKTSASMNTEDKYLYKQYQLLDPNLNSLKNIAMELVENTINLSIEAVEHIDENDEKILNDNVRTDVTYVKNILESNTNERKNLGIKNEVSNLEDSLEFDGHNSDTKVNALDSLVCAATEIATNVFNISVPDVESIIETKNFQKPSFMPDNAVDAQDFNNKVIVDNRSTSEINVQVINTTFTAEMPIFSDNKKKHGCVDIECEDTVLKNKTDETKIISLLSKVALDSMSVHNDPLNSIVKNSEVASFTDNFEDDACSNSFKQTFSREQNNGDCIITEELSINEKENSLICSNVNDIGNKSKADGCTNDFKDMFNITQNISYSIITQDIRSNEKENLSFCFNDNNIKNQSEVNSYSNTLQQIFDRKQNDNYIIMQEEKSNEKKNLSICSNDVDIENENGTDGCINNLKQIVDSKQNDNYIIMQEEKSNEKENLSICSNDVDIENENGTDGCINNLKQIVDSKQNDNYIIMQEEKSNEKENLSICSNDVDIENENGSDGCINNLKQIVDSKQNDYLMMQEATTNENDNLYGCSNDIENESEANSCTDDPKPTFDSKQNDNCLITQEARINEKENLCFNDLENKCAVSVGALATLISTATDVVVNIINTSTQSSKEITQSVDLKSNDCGNKNVVESKNIVFNETENTNFIYKDGYDNYSQRIVDVAPFVINDEIEKTKIDTENSTLKQTKQDHTNDLKQNTEFQEKMTFSGENECSIVEKSVHLSVRTSGDERQNTIALDFDHATFNPCVRNTYIQQSLPILNTTNVSNENSISQSLLDCKLNDLCQSNLQITEASSDPITEVIEGADAQIHHSIVEEQFNFNIESDNSKELDSKDGTFKEILTEEEDTVEGPFLDTSSSIHHVESNLLLEKDVKSSKGELTSDKLDLKQISNFNGEDDHESGEVFIDADTFDFFMKQNGNNVNETGKESLFLKFDPLCANKVDASGVATLLSNIQNSIGETSKSEVFNSQFGGSSDATFTCNSLKDFNEDMLNVSISRKPMMAVPPAVNNEVSLTHTNQMATPNQSRSVRQANPVSPAIAIIDRLISISGNSSPIQGLSFTSDTQQLNESEIILGQLKEALDAKEQDIQQLRVESRELKDRLCTLESHMNKLEKDNEEKLRKINELNETLVAKTKMNKNMAAVVEEYERTIAGLITESEQEKKLHETEKAVLIRERDEQTAHLESMEVSFSDLHSKYEKSKQIILSYKTNEDKLRKSIADFEDTFKKMHNNYDLLKQHATSKLNAANQEFNKLNKAHEAELLKLNAMIKRKELHITSLEETLSQKIKANEELTAICDELINKVG